jgi:D-alanyl-D-alanine carboxypeptidase
MPPIAQVGLRDSLPVSTRWRSPAVALALLASGLVGACSMSASSAPALTTTTAATTTTIATTTTAARPSTTTTTTIPPPTSTSTPPSTSISPPATLATTTTTAPPAPPETTTTLAPLPTPEVPFDGAQAQAFDAVVDNATVGHRDLSSSVAVVRNGQVLHASGFGVENPYSGAPATPATRFRLASISKVLTGTVIMQLAAEGAIRLDRPFLAQLGRADVTDGQMAGVTILDLLSHTSGVGKEQTIFFDEGATDWRAAGEQVLRDPLKWAPGTHFQYSNANFVLLGMLIEHVTGLPYEQAVMQRVAAPLGATGMRMAGTYDFPAGDAVYYATPDRNFMETLGPAGGWVATPSDIARLVDAFDPSDPAPPWQAIPIEQTNVMRAPQPTGPPSPFWNYGHGLMLFADGSWGHTGTVEQSHTIVIHRPDDLTVALFVSGESPNDSQKLATIVDDALHAAGFA